MSQTRKIKRNIARNTLLKEGVHHMNKRVSTSDAPKGKEGQNRKGGIRRSDSLFAFEWKNAFNHAAATFAGQKPKKKGGKKHA